MYFSQLLCLTAWAICVLMQAGAKPLKMHVSQQVTIAAKLGGRHLCFSITFIV
jgi:preprotein translocase subunit SecD